MKKLINYISAGQGLGLKLILIFSGLVSLVFAAYIRISGAALIPYAQDIADQMLPIKIENGIVAEPAKTIKVAHLRITEDADPIALPFIINTTVDELNTNELSSGIYLTRTAFYAVNKNEVRLYKLEDNMDLPKGDYREDFKSALTYTSIALFVIGWISLFIMYTALTFFYAGCSYAVSAIFSKKYNFNTRMRISTLCLITTYILFMTLDWLGLESGKIVFFITAIAIQSAIMHKLPSLQNTIEISEEPTIDTIDTIDSAWPEEKKEKKKVKKISDKKKTTTKKITTPKKKTSVRKKADK